jgi:hypothetical protein
MPDARSPIQLDREVMAMLLETNVQLVAGVLRADEDAPGQAMRAIAATRSLDSIVESTLRALVGQARAAGHTWAEIGELLHVSRQAAFQRFGGAGRSSDADAAADAVATPIEGAVERAVALLRAFLEGRFDDVRATFSAAMLDACSVELLADVRDRVRRHGGEVEGVGAPVASVHEGGFTVVDIAVALERADGTARVALDADLQVTGFIVRPKDAGR